VLLGGGEQPEVSEAIMNLAAEGQPIVPDEQANTMRPVRGRS